VTVELPDSNFTPEPDIDLHFVLDVGPGEGLDIWHALHVIWFDAFQLLLEARNLRECAT
jgi:hypothetical protein